MFDSSMGKNQMYLIFVFLPLVKAVYQFGVRIINLTLDVKGKKKTFPN